MLKSGYNAQLVVDGVPVLLSEKLIFDRKDDDLYFDFQSKSFVDAKVIRDGVLVYANEILPGDTLLGWTSGVVVFHKELDNVVDGGVIGYFRNPQSSFEEAMEEALLLQSANLTKKQRQAIRSSMQKNVKGWAEDYVGLLTSWFAGEPSFIMEMRRKSYS